MTIPIGVQGSHKVGLGPGTHQINPNSSNSGGIKSYSDVSYATALAGTGSLSVNTFGNNTLGQDQFYSKGPIPFWEIFHLLYEFNTQISSGTLSSATLKIYLAGDFSTTDFTIESFIFNYGSTLDASDYQTNVNLTTLYSGGAGLAASLSTSGIGADGLKTLTNNGSVLKDGVNTTGSTRICIASSRHRSGTDPNIDLDGGTDNIEYLGVTKASCVLELVIV